MRSQAVLRGMPCVLGCETVNSGLIVGCTDSDLGRRNGACLMMDAVHCTAAGRQETEMCDGLVMCGMQCASTELCTGS